MLHFIRIIFVILKILDELVLGTKIEKENITHSCILLFIKEIVISLEIEFT